MDRHEELIYKESEWNYNGFRVKSSQKKFQSIDNQLVSHQKSTYVSVNLSLQKVGLFAVKGTPHLKQGLSFVLVFTLDFLDQNDSSLKGLLSILRTEYKYITKFQSVFLPMHITE